jgi:hypothetical protein
MRPLILLFGMPRSGTTWLGKIFDSHPDTIYRHEPDSWGALNDIALLPRLSESERYVPAAQRFIGNLGRISRTKVSATVPVFRKEHLSASRYWGKLASVWSARLASRVLGELPVPEWVDYDRVPRAPIVWKSVESTGRFGFFGSRFPECRAILVLRHPCGHLASLLRSVAEGKVAADVSAFEDYGMFELLLTTEQAEKYGLTMEGFRSMTPTQRVAWRWALFNEKAINDAAGLPNCMVVRFEDVCSAPPVVTRTLFEFAGLSWADQTEQFIRLSTSKHSDSYYSVYKDPAKAANRWRSQLSRGQIDDIMAVSRSTAMSQYYSAD